MSRDSFTNAFGGVFEYSPWVAEQAWQDRPFATIEEFYQAMFGAVRRAPRTQIEALLCLHPDLAGKEAQDGNMTVNSVIEQSTAGLNSLTSGELQKMRQLNAAYRAKHQFPFIIAVRNYSKAEIFSEFERRLQNDTATEFDNNIAQVFNIVRMRLDRIFAEETTPLQKDAA
ncbi:2-oxo-4-hydroxy-4-carboxy-5-ureidoimidazoline decarboxylase [Noviherbaspirillum denitrificans]|nr:2-oxo-4-hydroxy-4-carboxy-5-ureidoimidazoline decarboxylase [Noviherbaspirillum denitrificans]